MMALCLPVKQRVVLSLQQLSGENEFDFRAYRLGSSRFGTVCLLNFDFYGYYNGNKKSHGALASKDFQRF